MAPFACATPALSQTQLSAYLEKINVPAQRRQPTFQTLCRIQKVLPASSAASAKDRAGFLRADPAAYIEADSSASVSSLCRARHATSIGTTWPCTIQTWGCICVGHFVCCRMHFTYAWHVMHMCTSKLPPWLCSARHGVKASPLT